MCGGVSEVSRRRCLGGGGRATPAVSSQVNLASTARQHTALVQGLGSDVISQAYTHGRLLLFLASHVISQAYTHADLSGLYPCAAPPLPRRPAIHLI